MNRDEVLAKVATLTTDHALHDNAWEKLLDKEDAAYREFEERFGPRRKALEAQDEELEILDHIVIVDSQPIHQASDRDLHTYRSFGTETNPPRIAMFNAARGHSTLSVSQSHQDYSYFRFATDDLEIAKAHALHWLIGGVLPPLVYSISLEELSQTAPSPESHSLGA